MTNSASLPGEDSAADPRVKIPLHANLIPALGGFGQSAKPAAPQSSRAVSHPRTRNGTPDFQPTGLELLKEQIVHSVDLAIRTVFPGRYFGLCHAYAIVGANVASLVLDREYRPKAGLAIIDSGSNCFLRFLDNEAFARFAQNESLALSGGPGSYHTWIESCPSSSLDRELIDIPFKHNKIFAESNGLVAGFEATTYLWGIYTDLVVDAELGKMPAVFPPGKSIWLKETAEGSDWIYRHIGVFESPYVKLTALALRFQLLAERNPAKKLAYSRVDPISHQRP